MTRPDPADQQNAPPGSDPGAAGDAAVSKVARYLEAATRDNTRRSYRQAIEHFEVTWGGLLPATADSVACYLADHAQTHAINTLRQRLAALSRWHQDQGFPDPTKAALVKQVLKGIREVHPARERQARPLQLEQLARLVDWLERSIGEARTRDDRKTLLAMTRNKALVLIGFWRGFRSDELCRLRIEHIEVQPGTGMTLYLPRSKSDRDSRGRTYRTPALSRLCPVTAYQDWVGAAFLDDGPLFRRVSRWGQVGDEALSPGSVVALLRRLFRDAGLTEPDSYSSHSLRRGFATWASANQWDVKALMAYVGWRDAKSALRYIEQADSFAGLRIEAALSGGAE